MCEFSTEHPLLSGWALPRALCSVCADRHHQGFQSNECGCKEHKPLHVVPDAFLSSVLAFAWKIADTPQPVPRATVVSYREVSGLGEINFSVWGVLLCCLIPPWSSVKLQPAWNILEYVTEVE